MGKVYRDKDIIFDCKVGKKDYFLGDKTDLMELIGNLIDNACKACRSQVTIKVAQGKTLCISIGRRRPRCTTRQTRISAYQRHTLRYLRKWPWCGYGNRI